jgi:hypothetical protein
LPIATGCDTSSLGRSVTMAVRVSMVVVRESATSTHAGVHCAGGRGGVEEQPVTSKARGGKRCEPHHVESTRQTEAPLPPSEMVLIREVYEWPNTNATRRIAIPVFHHP